LKNITGEVPLSSKSQGVARTDMFISTWNLHRSPDLWEDPEAYDPSAMGSSLQAAGLRLAGATIPTKYGTLSERDSIRLCLFFALWAGARKCVGDQFAMMGYGHHGHGHKQL
jgi:cytochrome P450